MCFPYMSIVRRKNPKRRNCEEKTQYYYNNATGNNNSVCYSLWVICRLAIYGSDRETYNSPRDCSGLFIIRAASGEDMHMKNSWKVDVLTPRFSDCGLGDSLLLGKTGISENVDDNRHYFNVARNVYSYTKLRLGCLERSRDSFQVAARSIVAFVYIRRQNKTWQQSICIIVFSLYL